MTRSYSYTVTFVGEPGDVSPLVVVLSLTGTGARVAVAEATKGNAVGGSFTLSLGGVSTGALAWDASAADMEAALEDLSTVGEVTVMRGAADGERGHTWSVTFVDVQNGGDVELLLADYSQLTGVGAVATAREVFKGAEVRGSTLAVSFDAPASNNGDAITSYTVQVDTSSTLASANARTLQLSDADVLFREQRVVVSEAGTSGTFRLRYGSETTGVVAANATGAELRSALEALEGARAVAVVVESSGSSPQAWAVTLVGVVGALWPLEPVDPELAPASSSVEVFGGCDACFYVPGLTAGKTYRVRVAGANSSGAANYATGSEQPRTIPGPLARVTLTVASSSELELFFDPPASDGGDAVSSYTVQHATSASFTGPVSEVIGAPAGTPPFSHLITGLSANTTYHVRISAANLVPFQVVDPSATTGTGRRARRAARCRRTSRRWRRWRRSWCACPAACCGCCGRRRCARAGSRSRGTWWSWNRCGRSRPAQAARRRW